MKNLAAVIAACLALVPRAWADSRSGASGATFLRLEQGARPMGMGGAFAAAADGATALWWNPAGIARSSFTEVTVGHTAYIEDINSQTVAIAHPVKLSKNRPAAIGASFTYLSIPGIDGFDENGNPSGKLDANSMAGGLALAAPISPQVTVGAQIKMIREKLSTVVGSGVAFDAGAQYRQDSIGVGLAIQHLGPAFRMGTTSSPLPTLYRAGLSYAPLSRLTLAFDGEKPTDGDVVMHLGGEARLAPTFLLRAGYRQMRNAGLGAGYTLGFGFNGIIGADSLGDDKPWWERSQADMEMALGAKGAYLFSFDYAFLSFGDFSNTHRLTFSVKF
ncbi:MAG: PorV/PorQ family protein [Elusimicrobia bacterium]|nr:PorV/PorQ family protein [Elusimicrobiota bacterium]